ncbi:hypothetical protein [Arsenophonus sp. PmNCSU2021_1]|uniref:hypothetical protein n=1 Tax=Arsenophonus sp. PmNCSU2021_1 TaxID=3118989 RepID=UPI002FF0A796
MDNAESDDESEIDDVTAALFLSDFAGSLSRTGISFSGGLCSKLFKPLMVSIIGLFCSLVCAAFAIEEEATKTGKKNCINSKI